MKRKISELSGAELDWCVARAAGLATYGIRENGMCLATVTMADGRLVVSAFRPSTDWDVGGPIIEREKIDISAPEEWADDRRWYAGMYQGKDVNHSGMKHEARGETALIAAMRCFVASKLGEEVELP